MISTIVQTCLCCDICGGAQAATGQSFSVSYNRVYHANNEIKIKELILDRHKWDDKLPQGWSQVSGRVFCPHCYAIYFPEEEK